MYHGIALIIIVVGKHCTIGFSITQIFKGIFICALVGHGLCLGILFTVLLRVRFLLYSVESG
jgi:hypothetical protein